MEDGANRWRGGGGNPGAWARLFCMLGGLLLSPDEDGVVRICVAQSVS